MTALVALGLAGCFTADEPMVSDDQAVAPYGKITFWQADSPEDKTEFAREGKAYVAQTDDSTIALRFRDLGGDLYLAEVTGDRDGKIIRLYSLVKLDTAANTAATYKSVAEDSDARPGMTPCHREDIDAICIENMDAYIAFARKAIDDGAKPDTTYQVKFE